MMNMMRKMTIYLLCAIGMLCSSTALAGDNDCDEGPGESVLLADYIMIRLVDSANEQPALQAFIKAFENHPANTGLSLETVDSIDGRPIYKLALDAPPGTDFDVVEDQLETAYTDHIVWGELLYDADAPESNGGSTGSTYADGVPEIAFQSQYATEQTNVPQAQARSTGAGTVVAVLDTGIDAEHPLLKGRVLSNGYDFVNDNDNTDDVGAGIDSDGDGQVDEMVGHGTFVAGLITLVAPDAKLLPIRIIDSDGRGDLWQMLEGVYYAIDQGVEVINVSVRSTYDSVGVEEALLNAREEHGILTVAAAGNFDLCRREYPASFDADVGFGRVLSVAALDHNDVKADFSSYNDEVFISAPGSSVIDNGDPDDDLSIIGPHPGGSYGAWEGTSMSAPLVAGAVALIRAQHPEWPANASTANEIETRLASTAAFIYDVNPDHVEEQSLGFGRLDIGAAAQIGPIAPALGDLDANGGVGVSDLLNLLSEWGATHTSADLDGNGVVSVGDLLIVLSNWG